MEEKILCVGKPYTAFLKITCTIGIVFVVLYYLAMQMTIPGFLMYNGALPHLIAVGIFAFWALFGWVFHSGYKRVQITVTNYRVYGVTFTGKMVDVPVHMITAVSTVSTKSVAITTQTGLFAFSGIENAAEVRQAISEALAERHRM